MSKNMVQHELSPSKGWNAPHLDFVAKHDGVARIERGRVCSQTAAGTIQLGLDYNRVPLLAMNASDSYDVAGVPGNFVTVGQNGADINCLVCTGGFEVQTTEFDPDQEENFGPGVFLTAAPPSEGVTTAGLVRVGSPYVDTIVGICNAAVAYNEHRVKWLSFWTYFLPAIPGGTN